MTAPNTAKLQADPSEEEVEDYLAAHPDFFARHEFLLETMRLPHGSQGVISLVKRQISLLREKNQTLEQKLLELVKVARENEKLSSRLHHLALVLIEADDLNSVLAMARDQLLRAFKCDFVSIVLFSEHADDNAHHYVSVEEALALFPEPFASRRCQCGGMSKAQNTWLFGPRHPQVASAVLVPLVDAKPVGYVAMGSVEVIRFYPGMGTLFLGYLGELITRTIISHQQAER